MKKLYFLIGAFIAMFAISCNETKEPKNVDNVEVDSLTVDTVAVDTVQVVDSVLTVAE